MSARIKRNSDLLKVSRKCTPAQRKVILENAHDDLLEALRECYMNVYLKTSPRVLKRLAPFKEELRFVADMQSQSFKPAKRSAFTKGGRLLPLILQLIVEQLASLLIK